MYKIIKITLYLEIFKIKKCSLVKLFLFFTFLVQAMFIRSLLQLCVQKNKFHSWVRLCFENYCVTRKCNKNVKKNCLRPRKHCNTNVNCIQSSLHFPLYIISHCVGKSTFDRNYR